MGESVGLPSFITHAIRVVLLTLHGSHDELFFKLYNRLPREVPSIRDLVLAGLWRTPGESSSKSARRL